VSAARKKRLRPGELDGLVIAHMRKHEEEWPLTPSAIGKAIDRSAGAVANCLERLAKKRQARLVTRKPKAYELRAGGSS
jgi:hypothetical protein